MYRQVIDKKILVVSILSSLFLHGLALSLLQQHSLWPSFRASAHSEEVERSRNKMLRETFQNISSESSAPSWKPNKISHVASLLPVTVDPPTHPPEPQSAPTPQHTSPSPASRKAVATPKPVEKPTLTLDLTQLTLRTPKTVQPQPRSTPHQEQTSALNLFSLPPRENYSLVVAPAKQHPLNTALLGDTVPRRALLALPSHPFPEFPTLDELSTSVYSDFFDLDILCSPLGDQPGYIFAITLIPRPDLHLNKLHQHYNFLIDRANSIQRDRLAASKDAVLKALEEIAPDDTFNIIAFDSKMEKLFCSPRPPDLVSLTQAKRFLENIDLGTFFAPADLYNPLVLTLPGQVTDDELYTTILLTDGENFSKRSAIRSVLQTWTRQNHGNVSLFTIGIGSDSQLAMLDAAAAFNKGRLYYSPTKGGIRRKLTKLMKNIQTPLAKNISCHGICRSYKNSLDLYLEDYEWPQLYLDQPFVILGNCSSLDDFILFVQGRIKGRWMNIKKTVSFVNAKKGTHSLKQEWALQQAYRLYKCYINDDNPEHLERARALLQPFNIQDAFP